jgi:hypothetical protein
MPATRPPSKPGERLPARSRESYPRSPEYRIDDAATETPAIEARETVEDLTGDSPGPRLGTVELLAALPADSTRSDAMGSSASGDGAAGAATTSPTAPAGVGFTPGLPAVFGALGIVAVAATRGDQPAPAKTIKVVDGYVQGAQIYIDKDRDGVADGDEIVPGALTDESGEVRLPASMLQAPVIATGGVSIDTRVPNRIALMASEGGAVLTPLTTLAQRMVIDGAAGSAHEAAERVVRALGLSLPRGETLFTYDPIAAGDASVHRAGVGVATLFDLSADGDEAQGLRALSALGRALGETRAAGTTVDLFAMPTSITTALQSAGVDEADRGSIVTAMAQLRAATSIEEIAAAQKTHLAYVVPAAFEAMDVVVGDSGQPMVRIRLERDDSSGSTRPVVAGDTLELTLQQGLGAPLSARVLLTESEIDDGIVQLPLPNTLSDGGLKLVGNIESERGWDSEEAVALATPGSLGAPTEYPLPGGAPPSLTASGVARYLWQMPHFDYHDALTAASLAAAAYLDATPERLFAPSGSPTTPGVVSALGWSPLGNLASDSWLAVGNAFAFAARRDSPAASLTQFVISFEGTNEPADWGNNLNQYGWTTYYQQLMPLVAKVLDAALTEKFTKSRNVDILFTGHSLGGAAATLAFADLFVEPELDFWRIANAPLARNDRIYQHPLLDARWTDEQIRSLVPVSTTYTIGAPSFLIDPNKIQSGAAGWLKLGAQAIIDGLPTALGSVLTVRSDRVPQLSGYEQQTFQFEHVNTGKLLGLFPRSNDIVAQLGDRDPGTQLRINLNDPVYERYGTEILWGSSTVTTALDLHGKENYVESVARAIVGAPLLKADNPQAAYTPLLPEVEVATGASDFLRNVSTNAELGNDIMVASQAASLPYQFNGGPGDDLYVLSTYGTHVVVGGQGTLEGLDRLYFALPGTLSKRDVANASGGIDRIFTLTEGASSASATVLNWRAADGSGANVLDYVGQIQPWTDRPWSQAAAPVLIA